MVSFASMQFIMMTRTVAEILRRVGVLREESTRTLDAIHFSDSIRHDYLMINKCDIGIFQNSFASMQSIMMTVAGTLRRVET